MFYHQHCGRWAFFFFIVVTLPLNWSHRIFQGPGVVWMRSVLWHVLTCLYWLVTVWFSLIGCEITLNSLVFSPWDSEHFLYWPAVTKCSELLGVGRFYHFSRSSWRPDFHEIFIPIFISFEPLWFFSACPATFSTVSLASSLFLPSKHVLCSSRLELTILWVGSFTPLVLEFSLPVLPFLSCALIFFLTPWAHLKYHFLYNVFLESSLFPLLYPPKHLTSL